MRPSLISWWTRWRDLPILAANCLTVSMGCVISLSMTAVKPELTHETLYLLALLDLKTERLLAECEPLVLANANREAQEAALQDMDERGIL